ncbi:unnamed protein product [Rotaria sp. Silwood1]|nr:unnamed protein product [Rotaria sp. Silwood1]
MIFSVVNRSNIQKLYLNNLNFTTEDISWPIQSRLEQLRIRNCSYRGYRTILRNSSCLKALVIGNCIMSNNDKTIFPSSTRKSDCAKRQRTSIDSSVFPQLISLTIGNCQLRIEHLEILLSLTPSLNHLKLMATRSTFDSICDGSYWEQFIQNNLPLLKNFQFCFVLIYNWNQSTNSINFDQSILLFKTPFWLNNKHWFVNCDYIPGELKIKLYTIPSYQVDDKTRSALFRLSSMNSTCRLILHSKTDLVNNTEDNVSLKYFLI